MAIFAGKFEKTCLIVSSGRTGTTALAAYLGRCYPQVRAEHEPSPSWRLRRASSRALEGRMSQEERLKLLVDCRRALVSQTTQPIYIESNPLMGGFLEAFDQVFPNAHLIHVVRDPRTYVRSGINFGAFSGLKRVALRVIPDWLPRPEHFSPPGEKSWGEMDNVERLAWYWSTINRELNRGEAIYGAKYLRIRFEELFAKDGAGLRRLTEFLGLPASEQLLEESNRERVNASTKPRMPKWEEWTAGQKEKLLHYCGELMRGYGYEVEELAHA